MKYLLWGLLIFAVAISRYDREKAYQKGFEAGAKSVIIGPPDATCTTAQALEWWAGTSNLKSVKRKFCA